MASYIRLGAAEWKYRMLRKNCTKFTRHNFAKSERHRDMQFSAKCSEINCLHDKGQCLKTTIKYSLFCSWQVNFLKTMLKVTFLLFKHR